MKTRDVAELVLLFHGGGSWSDEKSKRWEELTENREATTRTLCDCAREALKAEAEQ
jgi:isopentenyl phosphate kinase